MHGTYLLYGTAYCTVLRTYPPVPYVKASVKQVREVLAGNLSHLSHFRQRAIPSPGNGLWEWEDIYIYIYVYCPIYPSTKYMYA